MVATSEFPKVLNVSVVGAVLRKTDDLLKDDTLKREAMQDLECKRTELDPRDYADQEDELRNAVARGDLDGESVSVLSDIAAFDAITVWGHDEVPDRSDDPLLRGLDEWLGFAHAVRRVHVIRQFCILTCYRYTRLVISSTITATRIQSLIRDRCNLRCVEI